VKKPIPFGKYYLLERISVGGMAEVFKAKAFGVEGFERLIAVKRILPSIAEDEEFITMFIDEAKIAVQLTHANIAQIFDLGKVGDSFFIALEYVAGKDLRTIFDKMRKHNQTIPSPMAAYVIMKTCEGLDYAHNKKDATGRDLNLVHRDVSPQNVLISYDGDVKLIDFGIAKAAGKAGKTQAGILKGKFGYMSPEQVRGLPLDRRSDIFGLGICLWEMVTGERLFIGESDFSTLEKVRNVEIVPPSTYNKRIPEDLEKIILKALSKEVEDRYQSAMDLHDDLQSWMYTSGNFFARKDLSAFQQEVFKQDIQMETASNEGSSADLAKSTTPPPPPRVSRPPAGRGPARPGAPPPPPKVTQAPPPPPKPRSAGMLGSTQQRPTNPGKPVANTPPENRPAVVPPIEAKKTMLGMPAVNMPVGGNLSPGSTVPPPPARRPRGALPTDLQQGQVTTPVASGAGIDMNWDDDEPPTNIYDKHTAAEMAKAVVAGSHPPRGPASPPLPPRRAPEAHEFRQEHKNLPGKKSNTPLFIGIGAGAFVAAIVAAIFIFGIGSSGNLELKIDPGEDLQVILDDTTILPEKESPVKVAELTPGPHKLLIKKEGYQDKELIFTIKSGETLAKPVTLKQILSGFFLDTEPAGASIWVDDRPIEDKTPANITGISPGKHMVRVAKGDAYSQLNLEVDVIEGQVTKLPRKDLLLKEVEVTFTTRPQGATVVLISGNNKEKIGLTPVKKVLDTSKAYEVKYSLKDYQNTTTALNDEDWAGGKEQVMLAAVQLNKIYTVEEKTEPKKWKGKSSGRNTNKGVNRSGGATGKLSVQTRPWSRVSINGKFIKNTPLVNHSLKPGTYTVKVENPSFKIKRTFRVKIRSGKTTTLVKKLM